MPRFFVDPSRIGDGSVTIEGEDAKHISYSLRMAVGDTLTVCDGEGTDYECRLAKMDGETVWADVVQRRAGETESPARIRLYMAFPKGDKLETVVQKAVELGASEIVPFVSERCIRRPESAKAEKQTARLQRIATEAAKQCGRSRLPRVGLPHSFAEVLRDTSDLRLFCYEGAGAESLKAVLDRIEGVPATVAVAVGSEGGFSPAEAKAAEEAGFVSVNLGPRILRCETAPDFALSALCYRFEL